MKFKKLGALLLAGVLAGSLLVGCGSKSDAVEEAEQAVEEAAEEVEEAVEEAGEEVEEAAEEATGEEVAEEAETVASDLTSCIPEVPDLGGMTSLEWLLAQEDNTPLGGIVSNHVEDRADVYKALDKVDTSKTDIKVALFSNSLGAPWFIELADSAKAKCEEYGYEFLNYDANFNLNTQIEQLEECLALDVDYMIIDTADVDAEAEIFRRATEQGIVVILEGASIAQDDYNIVTLFISACWEAGYVNGYYAAQQTCGDYPDGINLGIMITQCGSGFSESRACGFISGYIDGYAATAGQPYDSKYDAAVIGYNTWIELRDKGSSSIPGLLNCVGYVTTENVATSESAPAAADLLTAHPEMELALVETDSLGTTMITEAQQMGIEPGKDLLICYASDGLNTVCDAIREGQVLSMGSCSPYPCGEGIVELIHDIQTGALSIEDANDLPANLFIPTYCITKDNVDEVCPEGQVYATALEGFDIITVDEYNAKYADAAEE